MPRRPFTIAIAAAATALSASAVAAQEVVKIGMSFSMTGAGFAAAGRQASAGARLYMQHHGNTVARTLAASCGQVASPHAALANRSLNR